LGLGSVAACRTIPLTRAFQLAIPEAPRGSAANLGLPLHDTALPTKEPSRRAKNLFIATPRLHRGKLVDGLPRRVSGRTEAVDIESLSRTSRLENDVLDQVPTVQGLRRIYSPLRLTLSDRDLHCGVHEALIRAAPCSQLDTKKQIDRKEKKKRSAAGVSARGPQSLARRVRSICQTKHHHRQSRKTE
jgi:hypothetical protein